MIGLEQAIDTHEGTIKSQQDDLQQKGLRIGKLESEKHLFNQRIYRLGDALKQQHQKRT